MIDIKNIKAIIFDMDGTLYQLDGSEGGIMGSTLYENVKKNSIKFIKEREDISNEDASLLWEDCMNHEVGASMLLSERYSITREDYFNEVWDIDPEGIVKEYEKAVGVVKALAKDREIFLLTSAPKIWKDNVLNYLQINNLFKDTYSGEMYGHKQEIFEKIGKKYEPKTILSVGDQMHTDIIPAKNLGMRTFLVSNPDKMIELCKNL